MSVRKWTKRMVILDLLLAGLLFFVHIRENETVHTAAGGWVQENAAYHTDGNAAGPDEAERRPDVPQDGETGKKIALTFDDGPHPRYTVKLLDGLKERGVSVTFFVTGANVEKYPEIVKRMQDEGHLIGNHTYHHIQLTAANGEQFRDEIVSTNEAIRRVTGKDTAYIRPPYGSWNKKYEEELNMFPVLWSVDPRDWCSDDKACIVKNTVSRIKEGDIILMHDQYPSSVAAALEIIDRLQQEGYVFVTVEELLLD